MINRHTTFALLGASSVIVKTLPVVRLQLYRSGAGGGRDGGGLLAGPRPGGHGGDGGRLRVF